jgi:hypothetical protein
LRPNSIFFNIIFYKFRGQILIKNYKLLKIIENGGQHKFFEIPHFFAKAPPEICRKMSLFGDFLVEGISGVYRGVEKSLFWSFLHAPGADRSDRKS